MNLFKSRPLHLGTLIEDYADRRQRTKFILSRPFDIAPEAGTEHDIDSMAELVRSAAGWLHAAGATPGRRVAIVKDNHWDYVILASAAARLGAVPAMLSYRLPPEVLQKLLKRLDPAVLVTTERMLSAGSEVGVDLASAASGVVTLDESAGGALSLKDVQGAPTPPRRLSAPDEPMLITHTSGTTGDPKLVVHSSTTIMRYLGRTESIRWPVLGMSRSDTVAISSAFAHMRIMTWTQAVLRRQPRKVLLMDEADPESAERVFRVHRPSHVEALPAGYLKWESLTGEADSVFSNVRLYANTFDAVHPPTVRRFLDASRRSFPVWLQGLGQSETGPYTIRPMTRRTMAKQGNRHPTTRNVGLPAPGFMAAKVVDPETLRPVPAGQTGVFMVRTPGRCINYLGEEDRWRSKTQGKWWNTGDLGVRNRFGVLRLLDREVDVIPGMSCLELEDVLDDRLPEVIEVVVIGCPGRPPLPVVCTEDGELDEAAWREATRDLPEMAEPTVLTWDEVPRTGTGKVRRFQLRDRLLGATETFGTGKWT
ncbi:class I adenylate-forming enzyme family protein [Actinomadura alba]|uniref:Acyl--CoA ligase n=1 Tax=Actinomadura alba TaxID=406431 RepID=A0ABR7LU85_9ACTN|nr:class I adenylate-forming enzyme family protein [Actinomadura alba]MBC6468412.1 acyl--CoA ligase [Actinomadura alba]